MVTMLANRISVKTAVGRGAWVKVRGLVPLEELGICRTQLDDMAVRLYYDAKNLPAYSSDRLATSISRYAAALRLSLADENIWARVLFRFVFPILGKKESREAKVDPAAGGCLLTALRSLLLESPAMGRRPWQKRNETAEFLGNLLFAYEDGIINRIVNTNYYEMLSVVEARAKLHPPSVIQLLSSDEVNLDFARSLLSNIYHHPARRVIVAGLPGDRVAQIYRRVA